MIPAGRTPATVERAAEIFGKSLNYFQNQRLWEKLFPATIKSFHRAGTQRITRIWDEEQLLALAAQLELPFDQQDIPVLPVADPQHPKPEEYQDEDLLDVVEAWEALREAGSELSQRAWNTYISRADDARETSGPKPDLEINGSRYWYRKTVLGWDKKRLGRGESPNAGRPKGSKDTTGPRIRPTAIARLAAAEDLLQRLPDLSQAEMVKTIASTQNVSDRQALRILKEARANLGLEEPSSKKK
ncbi:hypothetical protein LN042_23120 [Kitasatospora sp. RB6PN24]|uniref:hypothetical protein n=1 Tax=Kitasatospora humi TaxID=2893891 RepID=UPI001E34134A|nr:hypothetical protein [Kitasatospora humi]MCC9309928.1 hypothetical protein [Kitasatospora humi]